jgi:WD40 repeat protein
LWNLPDGELIGELLMDDSAVYALDFNPDGTQLASGHASGSIQIWDVTAQTLLDTIDTSSPVDRLVYSQENHLLISGHRNGEVNIWNAVTFEHIQTLRQHFRSIMAMEFSPSGAYLAVSSYDGTTSIWTLQDE